METLRVLARGGKLVPPYHLDTDRTFVGRVFDAQTRGWPARVDPTEVPNMTEFRREVEEGNLWPADKETADACAVPFDPDFGGEFSKNLAARKKPAGPAPAST